ncbi:universal stress protein UspA-like protein [Desulfitobacterium dichloroeliminans LMG P-21439]|uniref:Universal stress protein UspA-like protein n=1 Tax=Desulfitobacterium dichloroeliminans (strain LMG P-21439 / DCA1) TaxID=871963 RepID=L0FCI7_DESDL|nr:universal stress protein [Desulfitobacterium dichloroeliminans]AGA70725.1 universal stress protein UspA-like protein [Desulfitobacterium dichloroeliminans LMG P-21439]
MLKKILLAFDGSENALKAADYAIAMAKSNNGSVKILHVRETVTSYPSRVVFDAAEMEKELSSEAEAIIAQGIAKFADSGVEVKAEIKTGDPAEVICEEAEKMGATEIIIGSRGMNAVSRFFIGSVSQKVLTHAHCTALVVR